MRNSCEDHVAFVLLVKISPPTLPPFLPPAFLPPSLPSSLPPLPPSLPSSLLPPFLPPSLPSLPPLPPLPPSLPPSYLPSSLPPSLPSLPPSSNKSTDQLVSIEFNVLDSLNAKLERPVRDYCPTLHIIHNVYDSSLLSLLSLPLLQMGSSAQDSVKVPFQLPPGTHTHTHTHTHT